MKQENHRQCRNRHNHHENHHNHHKMMVEDFKKRFFISLIFTVPVLILSPLIQEFFGFSLRFSADKYFLFAFSTFIFFYGGKPFLTGLVSELKKKNPGMMTLIGLAISVAFFYSSAVVFGLRGKFFFWELVTLIDIMLLGHWIEMRSVMGASKALESLAELLPSLAHLVRDDGQIKDISIKELVVGNIVLIKPGEKIPADGMVVEGETSVNEAMLTGESMPVEKNVKDFVIGGSINGQGSIKVKVEKTGKESYISQVIELVRKAQASKSKTQDLANKVAMWLTITSISIGVFTLFAWIYLGKSFVFSLERMVTVMVITCPHALGLAIPLVVAVSTSLSVQNGFLIRNRNAFEKARNIDTVIFDKTGTLTKGEFGVTDIVHISGYTKKDILFYTASLESNSEHPIAGAILTKTKEENIEIAPVNRFISYPGKGIEGIVNGKEVKIMGTNYLKEKNIKSDSLPISNLLKQGKTIVYVLLENKLIGAIVLADSIKPESKQAIRNLKNMGIKTIMLTGDNKKVAQLVSDELSIDQFFAEVLPHQKVEIVKKIQDQRNNVAMVGDGVNDGPALVQADIGIAIGAGTDVAIESADIVLVKNNLLDVVSVIGLAKATYSKMQQNIFWASGYNIIAIPLAAGVLYNSGIVLSPALGAVLMSLSTVIVAINARFLSFKK